MSKIKILKFTKHNWPITYLKCNFYLYHLSITLRTIYSPITISCTYLWHFWSIYTHYNCIMLFVKVLRAIPITNLSNTWNLLINHWYVNIKDCPNQRILWARPDIIDYHPTESTKLISLKVKGGQMYRGIQVPYSHREDIIQILQNRTNIQALLGLSWCKIDIPMK